MREVRKIGNHGTHACADVFPLMGDDAMANMVDDVDVNGLLFPVVLIGDLILDGRNRYQACLLANERRRQRGEPEIEIRFVQYEGPTDLRSLALYVNSVNMARRDLSPGERALCSRRLLRTARVRKQRERNQPALPGVNEVDDASDAVLDDGVPELVNAVEAGDIPLSVAAEMAKCEPEEQRAMLAKLDDHVKEPANDNRSMAIELSDADVHALRALCAVGEESRHGVVRAGVAVVKRMVRL